MTADDVDVSGVSRLYRFDEGVQSFAVHTGASAGFQGVAPHLGEVLVADYIGDAIQRFSPSGTYLGSFAFLPDASFVETDSQDRVYATTLSGAAVRLTSSGTITQFFGVSDPRGIDADGGGNVYIVENGTFDTPDQLLKFAFNGFFLGAVPLTGISAVDISIDEAGNRLFLADEFSSNGIKVFDLSGPLPVLSGSIATELGASIVGVHYAPASDTVLAAEFLNALLETPRGFEYTTAGVLLDTYFPNGADFGFDIMALPPIPEPASTTLVLMAAGGIGVCRGRGRGRG